MQEILRKVMLKIIWRRLLAERVTRSIASRLDIKPHEYEKSEAARHEELELLRREVANVAARLAKLETPGHPWKQNLYIPNIRIHPKWDRPFMAYSTCSTADFLCPEFVQMCDRLGLEPSYHRKFWEYVFILHHGLRTGAVGPGKRALGFAVGAEPLPSVFAAAGAQVMATDAPDEIGIAQGWQLSGQHASRKLDLHRPDIIDTETFLSHVNFRPCDMTAIPDELTGYDFCWSACSFEHLGSIQRGLDFVLESVERTLRIGGVACHTTEFNLSSDTDTVEEGTTVLYRKSDFEAFIDKMQRRGHHVEPFRIAPDSHILDFYADTPPYSEPPHLRLRLLGYVSTSAGLVVTRGR
jgi:hypothetical protein